MSSGEDFPLQS